MGHPASITQLDKNQSKNWPDGKLLAKQWLHQMQSMFDDAVIFGQPTEIQQPRVIKPIRVPKQKP